MTDAQPSERGQLAGRAVELRVAANLENLALIRTIVGVIGAAEDLDIDTVEDLRLAVDEMCTHLIRAAVPHANLVVTVDPDSDAFVVEASTVCGTGDVVAPGSFGWHVLTSLVDDVRAVDLTIDGREFRGIRLALRKVGANR